MNINLSSIPLGMSDNIIRVYESATEDHKAQGLCWYDEANTMAQELVKDRPYSVEQAAGVMAVISPKLGWDLNQLYPSYIMDYCQQGLPVKEWPGPNGRGLYVTMGVREKCIRILRGEDPRKFFGPKTGAFFANILGDKQAVTVDRWAIRIAVNDRKAVSATAAALRKISDSYVAASSALGQPPAEVQATCWITYREEA